MNWKKWDENTWINMSNMVAVQIKMYPEYHLVVAHTNAQEDSESGLFYSKRFKTRAEAEAFIEELIK